MLGLKSGEPVNHWYRLATLLFDNRDRRWGFWIQNTVNESSQWGMLQYLDYKYFLWTLLSIVCSRQLVCPTFPFICFYFQRIGKPKITKFNDYAICISLFDWYKEYANWMVQQAFFHKTNYAFAIFFTCRIRFGIFDRYSCWKLNIIYNPKIK